MDWRDGARAPHGRGNLVDIGLSMELRDGSPDDFLQSHYNKRVFGGQMTWEQKLGNKVGAVRASWIAVLN